MSDMNHSHDAARGGAPASGGRLPKSVYVKRRLSVLAGLVGFVTVLVIVFLGPSAFSFGGKDPGKDASSDGGVEAEQLEEQNVAECVASDIVVEALTDASDYAASEFPELSLSVTNKSKSQCDINLGTETMVFQIHSGSELYWDSRDCQSGQSANLVRMKPDQTLETEGIMWDRTRSSPETCEISRDPVPAGGASYHLSAEIAGLKSETTKQFLIF